MSCSEIDQTFSTESRNRAVDIMDKEGKAYQLQLFSGVEHGFALRGNPENPYERKTHASSPVFSCVIDANVWLQDMSRNRYLSLLWTSILV